MQGNGDEGYLGLGGIIEEVGKESVGQHAGNRVNDKKDKDDHEGGKAGVSSDLEDCYQNYLRHNHANGNESKNGEQRQKVHEE